jgi:hypothetical protein
MLDCRISIAEPVNMDDDSGLRQPIDSADGIHTYRLEQWSDFHDFVEHDVFRGFQAERPTYIWRGQRDADWSLGTTFDRLLVRLPYVPSDNELEDISGKHLQAFKLATRGRRGINPAALEDVEWWALGQHFGLATPLLDWTRSPYAAAYFAFEELAGPMKGSLRAVYALDVDLLEKKNDELASGPSLETGNVPLVRVLDSLSNENPRLVSQGGLFTRAPIGTPIERWVSQGFEGSPAAVLLKILLPDRDRITCLRSLGRMNISHASLFPDLVGASRATNLKFELYPDDLRSQNADAIRADSQG